MRTMNQKRSEFVYTKFNELVNEKIISGKQKDDFKSFANSCPSMILQNGFGHTIAFYLAKAKSGKENDKHLIIISMVNEWLSYKGGDINNKFIGKTDDVKEFVANLAKMDQTDYLKAQKEALALLEWVKRYASIFALDE